MARTVERASGEAVGEGLDHTGSGPVAACLRRSGANRPPHGEEDSAEVAAYQSSVGGRPV